MPENIKKLIIRYKDTKFTIDVFEKYRFFKRYNDFKIGNGK